MAPDIRAEMEARFGADFSDVRIHADATAARSAAAIAANAYTVGSEIVFGPGHFAPGDPEGKRTLVHELAHVQQQRRGPVTGSRTGGGLAISDPSDSYERQAEATARQIVGHGASPGRYAISAPESAPAPRAPAALCVQRQQNPGTPQSCAGWESDPQSFSIRAAQNFGQDAFNVSLGSANDVKPDTATSYWVRFLTPTGVPRVVLVDMSQVPGTVTASGYVVPDEPGQRCSYNYSCDTSGAISFKRIACKSI